MFLQCNMAHRESRYDQDVNERASLERYGHLSDSCLCDDDMRGSLHVPLVPSNAIKRSPRYERYFTIQSRLGLRKSQTRFVPLPSSSFDSNDGFLDR